MGQDDDSQHSEGIGGEDSNDRGLIVLKDCLQDSPSFRTTIEKHEREISELEGKLEKVVSTCEKMIHTGSEFNQSSRNFSYSIKDLVTVFEGKSPIADTLQKLNEALIELQSFYSILLDQAKRSVQVPLRGFLSGELKKVKDTKKVFHRISEELNISAHRNAQAPKSRPQEAEEASKHLANMQTQFSHHAIDYAYQMNVIHCLKGHKILEHLLSFTRAQSTFFHQGYEQLHECGPYLSQVAVDVEEERKESEEEIQTMNSRHGLVISQHFDDGSPSEPLLPMENPEIEIETSGYLFKRGSNAFKSWSRRYFILKNNKLMYQSKAKEFIIVADDLRICTVKCTEELDRRFCFEVVTPSRSCMLQADSEALRKRWVSYLEAATVRALRISSSYGKKKDERKDPAMLAVGERESPLLLPRSDTPNSITSNYSLGLEFLDLPGNEKCADCGSPYPKWASINLGITLCIECSGIHRSLGVHISKVRSITLDEWDPDNQKIMCALGNRIVNSIYEFDVPSHVKKPTSSSSRPERETYIKLKYVSSAFVHPHPNFERPDVPLPSHPHQISIPIPPMKNGSPLFRRFPKKMSRPVSMSSGLESSELFSQSDGDIASKLSSADKSSSLYALAQNLSKMQGAAGGGDKGKKGSKWWKSSSSIGKFVSSNTPKLVAEKFSRTYSMISRGGRKKPPQPARPSSEPAISDDEEESSSSTPLLPQSSSPVPPRKPPRTYVTKPSDIEETESLFPPEEGDFSANVLSTIKEIGTLQRVPKGGKVDRKEGEEGEEGKEEVVGSEDVRTGEVEGEGKEEEERGGEEETKEKEKEGEGEEEEEGVVKEGLTHHIEPPSSDTSADQAAELAVNYARDGATLKRGEDPASSAEGDEGSEQNGKDQPDGGGGGEGEEDIQPAQVSVVLTDDANGDENKLNLNSIPGTIYEEIEGEDGGTEVNEVKVSFRDHTISSLGDESLTDDSRRYSKLSIMSINSTEWFSLDESSSSSETRLSQDVVSPPRCSSPRNPMSPSDEDHFGTPPTSPDTGMERRGSSTNSLATAHSNNNNNGDQAPDDETTTPNHKGGGGGGGGSHVTTDHDQVVMDAETDSSSNATEVPGSPMKLSTVSPAKARSVSDTIAPLELNRVKNDNMVAEEDVFDDDASPLVKGSDSSSVISSFSTQDLEDILKVKTGPIPSVFVQSIDDSAVPSSTATMAAHETNEESGGLNSPGKLRSSSRLSQSTLAIVSFARSNSVESGEEGEGEGGEGEGEGEGNEMLDGNQEALMIPETVSPNMYLCDSVIGCNIPGILCAFAHKADPNFRKSVDGGRTLVPTILAVHTGNTAVVEFLYQNGSKLNAADENGQGCLHHAVLRDDQDMVVLLIKRGVELSKKDEEGRDPLEIALEKENGEIVTLLRQTKFNAEQQNSLEFDGQVLESDRQVQLEEGSLDQVVYREHGSETSSSSPTAEKRQSTSNSSDSASVASQSIPPAPTPTLTPAPTDEDDTQKE